MGLTFLPTQYKFKMHITTDIWSPTISGYEKQMNENLWKRAHFWAAAFIVFDSYTSED